MRHHFYTILLSLLVVSSVQAQPFKLGNWRDHLPYLHGRTVAVADQKVYCASDDGLFSYHTDDNSLLRYSKLNGLNDFGISNIAYSSSAKVLIIAYSNANIDLLYDDDRVINLSDIKRKNVPGNKTINKIIVEGNIAYLACGFGIVVLDLAKREIKDTYYIGPSGSSMNIYDVLTDANYIYAASDIGIYRADVNAPDLSNYTKWSVILSDVGNIGDFKLMEKFNNFLLVNYSRDNSSDTLMAYKTNWGDSLFSSATFSLIPQNGRINTLTVSQGKLIIATDYTISIFDETNRIRYIDGSIVPDGKIKDALLDNAGIIWAADNQRGLLKIHEPTFEMIYPDGPNSSQDSWMQVVNGKLWAAHGARSSGWSNQYSNYGFSSFNGSDWITNDGISGNNKAMFSQYNLYDLMSLAIDPSDNNHLYIGSSGSGLLEFRNDAPVKFYRDTNSTLKQQFGNPGQVKVHGMAFDDESNLWVANAGVNTVLNVLKNNGTWKTFNLSGFVNSSSKAGDLVIDNLGIKWVILFENIGGKNGILAYDDNRSIDDPTDDKAEIVDFSSNRVRCMAVDKDGILWTGTEGGIYLIYPPNTTPQQILIKQDNSFQYLLENEIVKAIAVDAANQKWVGTENGGVYLFSSDGQQEINHFTVENSPLFSNNITSLAIDGKSGEVFIGTEKGLLSYQGTAIEGGQGCSDLLVYPNPVKHEYTGPIAIKGIVPNGIMKITDVTGNLVFQAKSLGAQAIWNGTNLSGQRVQTGVYMVFSSDADGSNTCITKFLFVN